MKTQILHLESFDDRHSILDQLNWGQADRVIMVWPVRGRPLNNKLDLKLVHRRCQSAGIKLALVCKNRHVIDFSSELGIPVFRSLRQAQRIPWEYSLQPHQDIQKPENKRTRAELQELIQKSGPPAWVRRNSVRVIAFVASILSVLILAAFLIPGARVEYLPEFETQSLALTLTASPEYQTYNLSGTIPAHRLMVTVEGRHEIEPSGTTGIPENAATGIVVFTNLTNQAITIPRGTVVRTTDPASNIRFTTTSDTSLYPESGATSNIPVEASNPGSKGNLPANSLTVIEGELARSLTVTNPEATTGGNERLSLAPTPDDYQTLSEYLFGSLWQTALNEARLTLEEQDVILDSEPRGAVILEETFNPPEPQPSSTLSLLLRVEFELLYLQWDELQAMGNAILNAPLTPNISAQPQTFTITSVSPPEIDDTEMVSWQVELSRQIFTIQSLPQTLKQIRGRTAETAANLLQSHLDLSSKPEILIFPDWWPILPLLEFRIQTIVLNQDR